MYMYINTCVLFVVLAALGVFIEHMQKVNVGKWFFDMIGKRDLDNSEYGLFNLQAIFSALVGIDECEVKFQAVFKEGIGSFIQYPTAHARHF